MYKLFLLLLPLLLPISTYSQRIAFYENGINSPWGFGIDYDWGFGKVVSLNTGFWGGINSQVNEVATFGDVYFAEFSLGMRIYLNKIDTWTGTFIGTSARFGFYNVPVRSINTTASGSQSLVLNRNDTILVGANVVLGYRWSRNLVTNMEGLPFRIILEPYLGWSLDFFPSVNINNVSRFTVGFSFKLGFFTHLKSKATLDAEAKAKENTKQEQTSTDKN